MHFDIGVDWEFDTGVSKSNQVVTDDEREYGKKSVSKRIWSNKWSDKMANQLVKRGNQALIQTLEWKIHWLKMNQVFLKQPIRSHKIHS